MDNTKRLLVISLSISILAIIGILIFTIEEETITSFASIRLEYLLISIIVYIISLITWAMRIKVISGGIGSKISLMESTKILLSSLFAAAITPSKAGGEPVRILLLSRDKLSVGNATAVVLGERIFDALVLGLMVPFCLFVFKDFFADNTVLNYVFLIAIGLFVVVFGIAAYVMTSTDRIKRFISLFERILSKIISEEKSSGIIERINEEIDNFRDGLWKLAREGKKAVVYSIILTLATWISYFLVASYILIGLNEDPSWLPSMAAQVVLNIIVMVPTTPGAVGVTEVTLGSLYYPLIENHAILGVFVVVWRLFTYYINLVVGGIVSLKVLKDVDLTSLSITGT